MPTTPAKFAREGVHVIGASCGGTQTAFVLRTIIDAKEDYREDQVEKAASVIESFFRGNHVRTVKEAAEARKQGRDPHSRRDERQRRAQKRAEKEASAKVIQSAFRIGQRTRDAHRQEQLKVMRELRDPARDGESAGWGRVVAQFDAASTGAKLTQGGARSNVTKATW